MKAEPRLDTLNWEGREVRVYRDEHDTVVLVDGIEIYDHEFDALKNEKYFELFKLI